MVVIVYISGISGNKEVKKRQQRTLLILDSKSIKYEVIDIAEPENEAKKDFMQNNSTSPGSTISDPTPRHPLPPQIFNDDVYCGDYDQFDMANEIDEMEKFLKLAPNDEALPVTSNAEIQLENGTTHTEVTPVADVETKEEEKPAEEVKKDEDKAEPTKNGAENDDDKAEKNAEDGDAQGGDGDAGKGDNHDGAGDENDEASEAAEGDD